MRFKGTFVLLIVATMFGGYVYFYEYKGGERRKAAIEVENRIWQFVAEDIVSVDLITQTGLMTAERGDDGQWNITAPREWLADNAQMNRLISSAARLDRDIVVEPHAADLARFGLLPAGVELRLTAKDGREYGIAFGESNPSGSSVYSALIGENEVFFVSATAARFFDVSAYEFRNRNVLNFERASVQSVIIRNPGGLIELEKDRNERWWFSGSEKREAGGPAVRELLNTLHLGRISDFFDENVGDYVNASLDKPMIDVMLTFGPGSALERLVVGLEKSELRRKSAELMTVSGISESFLARNDSRGELFFVERDLVDKLSQSANDLRDRALVPFQRWDVDAIMLESAHGKFQFVKIDGDWFIDAPSKERANWSEINNILDVLESPVVEWIDNPGALANYGVGTPTARVVLKKDNEIIAECAFGHSTANGVYAKVSGDSSIKVASQETLEVITGKFHPDS